MKTWGALPAWVLLGAFLIAPLVALVPDALLGETNGFAALAPDPLFWRALRNSVLLGLLAGSVSTMVGVPIAITLARQPEHRRRWLLSLLGLPLAFSGLVIAYGFILAFGRAGVVTQMAAGLGADPAVIGGWIYSVGGLAFAYTYYLIPRVALTLYPVFVNLDPSIAIAAQTLGASKFRAFWDAVVPEIAPSVLAAGAQVAAIAMGTYGTALALVGTQINILPLMLFAKVSDGGADFSGAAALSLVLMALCVLTLGAGDVYSRRRERQLGRASL